MKWKERGRKTVYGAEIWTKKVVESSHLLFHRQNNFRTREIILFPVQFANGPLEYKFHRQMEPKNRWFPCSLKNFNLKQWERRPKKKWSWKTVMLFPFFVGKWLDKILENWIQVPYVSFLFPFCGSCFNFSGKY